MSQRDSGWARGGGALGALMQPTQASQRGPMDELKFRHELLKAEGLHDQQQALGGIHGQLEQLLGSGAEADLLAGLIRAKRGSDFKAGMGGLETGQTMDLRRMIVEALQAGDREGAMAPAGALRPQDVMRRTMVQGDTAFDPMGAPGQAMSTTGVGQSRIGANQALSNQRNAAASLATTRRDDPGRFMRPAGAGGRGPQHPIARELASAIGLQMEDIMFDSSLDDDSKHEMIQGVIGQYQPLFDALSGGGGGAGAGGADPVAGGGTMGTATPGQVPQLPRSQWDAAIEQAQAAIAAGAPEEAVLQRLRDMGIQLREQ